MRVFELHFNPPLKNETREQIFDSFCYEPKNIYEKRLGSLYMVGEIRNLLPQNFRLLDNLSQITKEKFYSSPLRAPEKAFEECLKKANEFLTEEVAKENVSWLGNLSFAILSLKSQGQKKSLFGDNFISSFSKVGKTKILLLRQSKVMDIGKNLEIEGIDPYPLKIFVNAVSGKLSFGDRIIILTQEVFDFFSKKNLLNEFTKVEYFDERKIKDILKPVEKELSEISGVFLLIDTGQETLEKPKIITFRKELEKFSLKEVFIPLVKIVIKLGFFLKIILNKILFSLERVFHFPKLKIKFRPLEIAGAMRKDRMTKSLMGFTENLKGNLILILIFSFLLIIGFFIFQTQEKKQLKEQEEILIEVQEKISEAENFLIFKDEEKANLLLKEAREDILPLTKEGNPLQNKAISLKDSIETNLKNLSKLEVISEPKLIFEFDPKEFIPQKLVYSHGNLYFFSSLSEKFYKLNLQTKNLNFYSFPSGKDNKAGLATTFNNSILFFLKPNKIIFFKESEFGESLSLKPPYSDSDFIAFSSYQKNLYFLDRNKGEIIKYLSPLNEGKELPQLWLIPQTKKAIEAKSMAVDGSVWILNENNTVSRYYSGQHQANLTFDIFPLPKRFYKISTLPYLSYLYLLEPVQNRLIILEKNSSTNSPQAGRVVKQFQSEKFENLKDFAVSESGKIIYLLNNQSIYEVNF